MDCRSTRLSYRQTGAFSKLVGDYVDHSEKLTPFLAHPSTIEGIKQAIESRKKFATNRELLVQELRRQYENVETSEAVKKNIDSLLSNETFVITTAHQNNIFTGPLYFIYKILHAIKLAAHLTELLPGHKFVPVYYIGSEDADLDELNNITLDGEKIVWKTRQKGAVGRMKVDKELLQLIDKIEGQLAVLPRGSEAVELLRTSYSRHDDIQTATFKIVNALFAWYGLVVLMPDNANLKRQMIEVFEDDLLNQTASAIVEDTSSKLGQVYKVQAHPRDINLFYLEGDIRERIEWKDGQYEVLNTKLSFTKEQLLGELRSHPERFSPNVILRGLYQETILPGVAFIGGGGELAYWLELKDLFTHYKVPYPVQVLRNSFLVMEQKWTEKAERLQLTIEDIFLPGQDLINKLVRRDSEKKLQLNGTLTDAEKMYEAIKNQAASIDITLGRHVESLKTTTLHRLKELEKKMLRAEKRKFLDQQRQVEKIKMTLFPQKGLQERQDNMLYFYAQWGQLFIQMLYDHSLSLEQEFVVLQVAD